MPAVATPSRSRWRVVLLAALTAVLALLLPSVPASAATSSAAETRVGVFAPANAVVVAVHECITAGQRPVRGPSQLQVASGSCVAAEAGSRAGTGAVDDVLSETAAGSGHLTSAYRLSADDALEAGQRWVGPGYRELGKPGSGVFRSDDGLRHFRIDASSLTEGILRAYLTST